MKSFRFQKHASILYMLVVNMEKELCIKVYERIHCDFNVTKFKKYFYYSNISYFQLMDLLNERYPGCKLYFSGPHSGQVGRTLFMAFLIMFTFIWKVCDFFTQVIIHSQTLRCNHTFVQIGCILSIYV